MSVVMTTMTVGVVVAVGSDWMMHDQVVVLSVAKMRLLLIARILIQQWLEQQRPQTQYQ
jgi:hypothetical protein